MAITEAIKVKIKEQADPPAFDILTFLGVSSPREIGETLATPAFTATYNRTPTSVTLTDDDGNPAQDVSSTPGAFSSVNSYVKSAPNESIQWDLAALDGLGSDSESLIITWRPRVFTGILAGPGPYTEADIESLAAQALLPNAAIATSLSPATQYIVHAYPDSYGPLVSSNFQIGDLGPGDMTEVQSGLSITNAFAVALGYRVARSDNLLNAPGGIAFTVTP